MRLGLWRALSPLFFQRRSSIAAALKHKLIGSRTNKQARSLDFLWKSRQLFRTSHGGVATHLSHPLNSNYIGMSSLGMDEIRARKKVLRRDVRAKLRQLTDEQVQEQSANVWRRLFDLPAYKAANSVALFLSMPHGEIKTDEALTRVLGDGKKLYVPQVGENFEHCDMDMFRVERCKDATKIFYRDWPRNKWQIPEPPRDANLEYAGKGDIDLIIVPGLAFDENGGRLGQGKGYYDRFIEKMRKDGKPSLVAVGLEVQLVEDIPTHDHDYAMDAVILPHREIILSA